MSHISGNANPAPIPEWAQNVPTWIWLRYFSRPQPTVFFKNEEKWVGKEKDWAPVKEVLETIEREQGPEVMRDLVSSVPPNMRKNITRYFEEGDEGMKIPVIERLKFFVKKRREAIEDLRSGTGKIILEDLGVQLERMNLGDIDVIGGVSDSAENEAKEEQQKKGEIKELEHIAARIRMLMTPVETGGAELTREQAIEMVQLSLGKTTKAIDSKTLAVDEATARLLVPILGRFFGGKE